MTSETQDVTREKIEKKLQTLNGVGEELAGALYDAGYRSPTQVRLAPDVDLISIAGIGEHNLEKIRTKDTAITKRKVGRREIEWNPHIGGPVVTTGQSKVTGETAFSPGVGSTPDAPAPTSAATETGMVETKTVPDKSKK
jgi:hypothetical protein